MSTFRNMTRTNSGSKESSSIGAPSTLHSPPSTPHSPLVTLHPLLLTILLSVTLVSGCARHKDLVNFQEASFPVDVASAIPNYADARIQPQDILRITVHSFNDLAAKPFNIENPGLNVGGGQNMQFLLLQGYLVNSDGMINFPVLGEVPVAGLSLVEATELLQSQLRDYLEDGVVNMRFLNFRYTVFGEVNIPGTYTTMNPRITLLEAIGTAGDLTPYANRETVLLVREENGQRTFTRINLKESDLFTSPWFYLRQNDVIYIEPTKARIATVQDPIFRWISLGSATISLVAIITTLVK